MLLCGFLLLVAQDVLYLLHSETALVKQCGTGMSGEVPMAMGFYTCQFRNVS